MWAPGGRDRERRGSAYRDGPFTGEGRRTGGKERGEERKATARGREKGTPELSSTADTRQDGGRKKRLNEGERGAVLTPRKRRVCIEAAGRRGDGMVWQYPTPFTGFADKRAMGQGQDRWSLRGRETRAKQQHTGDHAPFFCGERKETQNPCTHSSTIPPLFSALCFLPLSLFLRRPGEWSLSLSPLVSPA